MGEPIVCLLQGKWRSTDRWKPTCRMKTRIQQLKWLERITENKKKTYYALICLNLDAQPQHVLAS